LREVFLRLSIILLAFIGGAEMEIKNVIEPFGIGCAGENFGGGVMAEGLVIFAQRAAGDPRIQLQRETLSKLRPGAVQRREGFAGFPQVDLEQSQVVIEL